MICDILEVKELNHFIMLCPIETKAIFMWSQTQ